jgi:ABC-type bacteriocin/lantibiotic exporter with double-glycine peptidase domain
MANVITRIVEIEKQCAEEIEKADREYKLKIEEYRLTLEEKKEKEFAALIFAGNEKFAQALNEAKEQTQAESMAADKDRERLVQDVELKETIKEKIVSILLSGD